MKDLHTRNSPNGTQSSVVVPNRSLDSLKFGEKINIFVHGKPYKAVVDVIVAAFWGGPQAAIEFWNNFNKPHPKAMIKIVWKDSQGSWQESRDIFPCSEENFISWIEKFEGNTPPTPMP